MVAAGLQTGGMGRLDGVLDWNKGGDCSGSEEVVGNLGKLISCCFEESVAREYSLWESELLSVCGFYITLSCVIIATSRYR